MKIVLVHYKFYIQGGPEKYMFKFIELAKKNGHTIIPFSVDYPQNISSEYKKYFARPNNSKSGGLYDISNLSLRRILLGAWNEFHNFEAVKKIKELIRIEQPDLMYCLLPGILSSDIFKVAKQYNLPIILRVSDYRLLCGVNVLLRNENICEECIHGNYFRMIKHKCVKNSKLLSILRAWSLSYNRRFKTYRHIDAVIFPSRFTSNKFLESNYFPPEKIHVVPTFLDCTEIIPNYTHKNYVLCLGRFSPEKGYKYVVEALKYLKDTPISVVITGNKNDCGSELKTIIQDLNIEEKVQFIGFLDGENLDTIIQGALCIACPAIWYENFPNVVIEAYSYGKPVIASSLGSLPEIIDEGKTGFLFEVKNSEQIAQTVKKLYNDSNNCTEMGHNARKKCENDFNSDKHWIEFMKIYEKIKK